MKTSFLPHRALIGSGLFFSSAFLLTTFAGPGPQYWQSVGKSAHFTDAHPEVASMPFCPGFKLVPVMALMPAWSNGKGPLTEIQVGTKRTCTVCPVTTVVSTARTNGREPVTRSDTPVTRAQHDCGPGCVATKS